VVAMANFTLPKDEVTAAAHWATGAADGLFHKQVSFLSHFASLASCAARCQIFNNNVVKDSKRTGRQISADSVKMLSVLRGEISQMDTFLKGSREMLSLGAQTDSFHCNALDFLVSVDAADATLQGARQIASEISGAWVKDITDLAESVSNVCPQWAHVREDLLKTPEVMKALLDNVGVHYTKIGPLVNELREHLKLVKVLHGDGHGFLMKGDQMKAKSAMATHGIETVAVTYLVWQLCKDIPEMESQALIRDRVDTIRKKVVGEHRVKLTQQMETVLAAIAAGEDTSEELIRPGSGEAAAHVAAPPSPSLGPSSTEAAPPVLRSSPPKEPPIKKAQRPFGDHEVAQEARRRLRVAC